MSRSSKHLVLLCVLGLATHCAAVAQEDVPQACSRDVAWMNAW